MAFSSKRAQRAQNALCALINAQKLSVTYGADPLFHEISLTVPERGRIGLIGPNGSGKSTLLEMLAGRRMPDSGEVSVRNGVRIAYVAQVSEFPRGQSVRSVLARALDQAKLSGHERARREAETLGRAGFSEFDSEAANLSGGWRKRLAIAEALVQVPDVLLLDEPTNHLDLAGIEWLEKLLDDAPFACIVISHDRYFLENVATEIIELNRVYPEGLLRVQGNYSTFLEKKNEFLAAQSKRQESLENRVRTELEWLRRGPKARGTKSKARIDKAREIMGELKDLNARTRTGAAGIEFSSTDRQTKRLVEIDSISYRFSDRNLFEDVEFTFTAGMRVGLVGANGSGKTTLLRLIRGEIQPFSGEIRRAPSLRIVYFDQNRNLDPEITLRRALAPDGDSVMYRDRPIHVAAWASRFLFSNEQLDQPTGRLSGGERARVLIAKLMLEPADLLLLDEPANDLDISTLEILEESLLEFSGALVLVTHDRFMLDRISTVVLGLDGEGGVQTFADYAQWEYWQTERQRAGSKSGKDGESVAPKITRAANQAVKKKLSYLDNLDYQTIEERIGQAEDLLRTKRAALENPDVTRDGRLIEQAYRDLEDAQKSVDDLYARWAELEGKIG